MVKIFQKRGKRNFVLFFDRLLIGGETDKIMFLFLLHTTAVNGDKVNNVTTGSWFGVTLATNV